MSPRLDVTLDRRAALSALLATGAAVMGLGALPGRTAAQEPISPDARLDGCFLGFVNRQQSATQLRIFLEDGQVWARPSHLRAHDWEEAPVLTSNDPAVVRFVSELIGLFPVEPYEAAAIE